MSERAGGGEELGRGLLSPRETTTAWGYAQ